MSLDVVAGIERLHKLVNQAPGPKDIRITTEVFDDIVRTIDYRMDNWCGFDLALDESGNIIAYIKGRDACAEIWLDYAFAQKIKFSGQVSGA